MTNYQKSEEVLKYQNRRPVDNFNCRSFFNQNGAKRPIKNPPPICYRPQKASVARMKRSVIRENGATNAPHSASLHAGYILAGSQTGVGEPAQPS